MQENYTWSFGEELAPADITTPPTTLLAHISFSTLTIIILQAFTTRRTT